MKRIRFIPDTEPTKVVSALSETIDWGQEFMGVSSYRKSANTTGTGVKVAVLDTGIDPSHPDLRENLAGSIDFTGDSREINGHGTHCAGIIGARANGIGVVGVAPDCSLYSVRVLDSDGLCPGDFSWIINGFEWCLENEMDIINLSLGSSAEPPKRLRELVLKAVNSGIIIVAAAGNEGQKKLNWPARYDEVISVAALDKDGKIANFSNIGDGLKTAAPGCDIYSTWTNGEYAKESGTSMASPFVAGILALMLSYHRDGNDHDTPFTNWTDAISHLNTFAQPGAILTQNGDPLNIGLLNFGMAVAKRVEKYCEENAMFNGIPLWRIKIYKWAHTILRKIIL